MGLDATVVVATFGDRKWQELAESRAVPSAVDQAPVVRVHGDTLAQARNAGLAKVKTPYVIHLDADDELAPGYIEALGKGTRDLRAPSVSYVRKFRQPRHPGVPKVAGHEHDCAGPCLVEGNYLVVGTAAPTELVKRVGGWGEYPLYEDWDLWLRCYLNGATVETIPEAVYIAHVNPESRNRAPAMSLKNRVHREIVAANGL